VFNSISSNYFVEIFISVPYIDCCFTSSVPCFPVHSSLYFIFYSRYPAAIISLSKLLIYFYVILSLLEYTILAIISSSSKKCFYSIPFHLSMKLSMLTSSALCCENLELGCINLKYCPHRFQSVLSYHHTSCALFYATIFIGAFVISTANMFVIKSFSFNIKYVFIILYVYIYRKKA
jgi:hypothetical protein